MVNWSTDPSSIRMTHFLIIESPFLPMGRRYSLGTSGTPRCLEGGKNIYGFMMVYTQSSAIFLRYIFVGTLCALELVHPSDVFYSSVLQIVLCHSVCADGRGTAAPRLLEWYLFFSRVLRFWLWFASPCRKSYCSDCMKVANGALAAFFLDFGADDFLLKIPFEKCVKIVFFPLGRRDLVLELQFV